MKRKFLFDWYQTPRGKLLQGLEADYIQRAITVSCKQTILQIGGLGWESEFIDCTLYKKFTILDAKGFGCELARKIQAKAYCLPLKSDSVDMIIVPHLLEFDASRFTTMREIERVLKPEGIIVVINFNPWSIWVRYLYLWDIKWANSWRGHFISLARTLDWLRLLNFEVIMVSEFGLDNVTSKHGKAVTGSGSLTSTAYAVKAIKRRYNLIPLAPVKNAQSSLAIAGSLSVPVPVNHHE